MSDDKRAALERLRQQILAAAPDATETMSYGLPTFKLDGRWFAAFGATKKHCSFYVGLSAVEGDDQLQARSASPGRARDEAPPGAPRGAPGALRAQTLRACE